MNNFQRGQSLMELVIGIGLISIVAGAIAIIASGSLQNTQFSKNQVQATKLAQENLEKVRAIKNTNFGVCTQAQVTAGSNCSSWDEIWAVSFGKVSTGCTGCTFELINNCVVNTSSGPVTKLFCLRYNAARANLGNGFTGQILVEDEAVNQKRITSKVFWTSNTGEHSSDLVTILSRR